MGKRKGKRKSRKGWSGEKRALIEYLFSFYMGTIKSRTIDVGKLSLISRFVTHFWNSDIWKILLYDRKTKGKRYRRQIARDIGGLIIVYIIYILSFFLSTMGK